NVDHSRLRTECNRGPVLTTMKAWTEVRRFTRAGFACGINVRLACFRIEAPEDVLVDVGFSFDKVNRTLGALQKPEVAISSDVDESLDRAAIATIVDQDWWRNFVPIPRVVGMVLEVTFDLPRCNIDGDGR